MIWHLSDGWTVALSAMTWLGVSLAVGRVAVGWSTERVSRSGPLTNIRRWERDGRFWQRWFRVLRWKDALPEAGEFFGGGQSKRRLGSRSSDSLVAFQGETIRAERVHWLIMASGPAQLLWCRPTVGALMVAFGVGFNAPFIVVQRSNRARLERILRRRVSLRAAPPMPRPEPPAVGHRVALPPQPARVEDRSSAVRRRCRWLARRCRWWR